MKSRSLFYLLLVLAAIILYGWLDPQVYAFPKCPFRSLTGWLCPGCGSQRAMHQALHGHFSEAFQLNPLFFPAIGYALIGLAFSAFDKKRWPAVRMKWYGSTAAWISLGIIMVFWIGRNLI